MRILPAVGLIGAVLFMLLSSAAAQSVVPSLNDSASRADRLGIAQISSIDVPRSTARYERAVALGARWNRWPLYWDRVEVQAGAYEWAAYDALIEDDYAYGLQLNVVLLGIPAFHRAEGPIAGLYEPIFADGSDTPSADKAINPRHPWANFVDAAVRRYMPGGTLAVEAGWPPDQGVRVWEIWNEPDLPFFWSGTSAEYARLLKVAYLVIKRLDPQATVMHGGLLYPTQANWLAEVLSIYQDEADPDAHDWYLDAVGVHNYGDAWRTGWLTLVARQTLVEFGLERPIWVTETGVPIWDDYPGPTWTAADAEARAMLATAAQQAAFLVQSAAYAWAEGAQVLIYHQLYDDCGNQPPGTDFAPLAVPVCPSGSLCAGDVFGIFRNPDDAVCFSRHPQPDTARPVGAAFRLLAQVFGAQPFSRRGIVDDLRSDGVVTITFLRPTTDERVVIVWNTRTTSQAVRLPALGVRATVHDFAGSRELTPDEAGYTLVLAAAEQPRQRFLDERMAIDIGGAPVILVEVVSDRAALAQLAYLTFESTTRPVAPAPPAGALSAAQIEALIADSPTGVVFYSREHARLRDRPSTEDTRVVATLRPRQSLPVIGQLADGSWLQVDLDGQPVWVAAFLGDIYGDTAALPVLEMSADANE